MSEEEVTTVEADEVETVDEESTEEKSEDEDESDSSSTSEELDLDAELEKERKAGEPDPVIAEKRFKESKEKREKESTEEDEADKPLTQKDVQAILDADRKERRRDDALVIARGMSSSEKEAELVVAKWSNRTFPKTLTLTEQIQEAYVITHSKKLIGERNEAMRALKGKVSVKTDSATTHRDAGKNSTEPKLPPGDMAVLRQSGFSYNNVSRQYEKKLPNGDLLVRDNKTKQLRRVKKS